MKRIAIVILVLTAATFLSAAQVSAQEPPPQPQQREARPPMDPLADVMFPPDLIMGHTRELGLTAEQKTFMREEIQKSTTRFNELQWQAQDLMEALHETMKGSSVNQQQALAQLDKVLDAEREMKRLHLSLAISIKNKLTPDQQGKLHALMMQNRGPEAEPGRGPGRGPGRRPGGPVGPGPGGPGPGGGPPARRPED